MTLEEAKDQIAKKHGHVMWCATTHMEERQLFDEVTELYARSKWDECYNEIVTAIHANGKVSYVPPQPEFHP